MPVPHLSACTTQGPEFIQIDGGLILSFTTKLLGTDRGPHLKYNAGRVGTRRRQGNK